MAVKKENGKWRVDFWHYFPDGSRRRVRKFAPVNTRRYAEKLERDLRKSAADGDYWRKRKEVGIPTFETFQAEFMEDYAKAHNKPSEIAAKKRTLRNHLIPFFGKMRLDQIGRREIKAYQNQKLKVKRMDKRPKFSPKTINNHVAVLRRILAEAVELEVIQFVPKVKKLPSAPPKFDFLSFEDADKLIAAADGQWRNLIALALKTGLRQGELLGLRWKDVDLENRLLLVQRTIFRGTVTTPKSNKYRAVSLCDDVVAVLKDQEHRRGPWVFCDKSGTPLTDHKCKAPMKRAYLKAGLRKVTWHMLRHTFASHLVMKGVHIRTVQELLGHATLDMTMRYSHLSPGFAKEEVQVLNTLGHYRDTLGGPKLEVIDNTG
jgi:integrase